MKKALVFWFMFWGLLALAYGQNEFEKNVYVTASGDSLNYRLLRPEIEKEGEKYPLVLFLHGAGERGSDNEKQLFHGSQMWLNPLNRENYPAFVLFPQCPESGYWAYTERHHAADQEDSGLHQRRTGCSLRVLGKGRLLSFLITYHSCRRLISGTFFVVKCYWNQ